MFAEPRGQIQSNVLTNNDVVAGNSITVFLLNPANGSLKAVKSVSTGGTGLGGGYSAIPLLSINSSDNVFLPQTRRHFEQPGDRRCSGVYRAFIYVGG